MQRTITLVYETCLLFVYKNVTFFSYVDKKAINGIVMASSILMNEETPIKKWFELVREYLEAFCC
jgi:hypothetical protein